MSGAHSRRKGRAGEQEVARILRDWLNLDIHRNWQQQAAQGGSDIIGVDGWAIEVKRRKVCRPADIRDWWHQTRDQAAKVHAKPALLYREDGYGRGLEELDKWRVMISTKDAFRAELPQDHACLITLRCWLQVVREGL